MWGIVCVLYTCIEMWILRIPLGIHTRGSPRFSKFRCLKTWFCSSLYYLYNTGRTAARERAKKIQMLFTFMSLSHSLPKFIQLLLLIHATTGGDRGMCRERERELALCKHAVFVIVCVYVWKIALCGVYVCVYVVSIGMCNEVCRFTNTYSQKHTICNDEKRRRRRRRNGHTYNVYFTIETVFSENLSALSQNYFSRTRNAIESERDCNN